MIEQPITTPPEAPQSSLGAAFAASPEVLTRRKFRHFKDKLAAILIAIGGLGVIAAVLLIFLYLIYEVLPLFRGASIQEISEFQVDLRDNADVLHLAVEERLEVAMRLGSDGQAVYFNTDDGEVIGRIALPIPEGQSISSFALDTDVSGIFALGLSGGDVLIAQYGYDLPIRRSAVCPVRGSSSCACECPFWHQRADAGRQQCRRCQPASCPEGEQPAFRFHSAGRGRVGDRCSHPQWSDTEY